MSHARGSSLPPTWRDLPVSSSQWLVVEATVLGPRVCSCVALLQVLICSWDALTWSHKWMGDITHLLLVLPAQFWIWVGQGVSGSMSLVQEWVGLLSMVVGRQEI